MTLDQLKKYNLLNLNVLVRKQRMDFFTGGCIIMDYDIWPEAALTDGLESIFYQLFGLSFWRHPFTADKSMGEHLI